MSAIPLHDLDEVATKGDIALLRTELGAQIGSLRAELRGEIGSLRAELGAEIGSVRGELLPLSEAVKNLDQKLDRLILILIAGLFVVIATLIGVGLVG